MALPPPLCSLGYTRREVVELTVDRHEEFQRWIYGQTVALCEARRFNHETREYEPNGCDRPHGMVVYPWDLARFLRVEP